MAWNFKGWDVSMSDEDLEGKCSTEITPQNEFVVTVREGLKARIRVTKDDDANVECDDGLSAVKSKTTRTVKIFLMGR
ncbi:MAG: hypothetical protein LBP78_01520 [Acidaminococcales bacterium]|jgi:hypothetical protein|nr:hypothetical protein [Acidaminococcales bacterium]